LLAAAGPELRSSSIGGRMLQCVNDFGSGVRDFPMKSRAFLLTRLRLLPLDERKRLSATQSEKRGSGEMNKQELIGVVADLTGLSRGDATRAVEGVFDTITGALKRGDEVRLVGFGTFSCSKRKASTGRNPRTGEPMQIKESTQPKFKAGKVLKDSVGR
jgi:DNA-binding protein HU-beta